VSLQLHIRLKDTLTVGWGHARSVVIHGDDHPRSGGMQAHDHLTDCVTPCVADQVAQRQHQCVAVGDQRAPMRRLEAQSRGAVADSRKALFERLEKPPDIQPVCGDMSAATELRVSHAGRGQLLQPRDIGLQAVQQRCPFRVVIGDLHHGQREAHPRQWRTRFVGDRLGQNPLPFHRAMQLRGHAGQRLTQRPHEMGADGGGRDGQLTLLDRQRHVPERIDIAPQAIHQEVQRERDGDDEDADHHCGIHVLAVVQGKIGLLGFGEIAQYQHVGRARKSLIAEVPVWRQHQPTLVQMLQRRNIQYVRRLGQRHDLQRVGELHLQVPGQLRPVCLRRVGIARVQKVVGALQLCADLLFFSLLGE